MQFHKGFPHSQFPFLQPKLLAPVAIVSQRMPGYFLVRTGEKGEWGRASGLSLEFQKPSQLCKKDCMQTLPREHWCRLQWMSGQRKQG